MANLEQDYNILEESLRKIRDERGVHANTAKRIGTALLDLLRLTRSGVFDEIIFKKVLNKPEFLEGLIALGTIVLGEYAEGLKGGIITPEGAAELKDLWVREHAMIGDGNKHYDVSGRVLPALEVKGDSSFSGDLSSPEFVSAFLGGLGWAIQSKEFVNAAGEVEQKYTLEIDNVVVRNTLRVFEMIVSQLLGENANRVFSDMMVVDHFDKRTGKVMLKTQDGQLFNSLRAGDYIEVQQYNGDPDISNDWYVTKAYEFRVKEVGIGKISDGKDRLDWLTFENFTTQMEGLTPEKAFKEGDTLVRVDSERADRKGVITIMAVGENTPYMDILYGKKTDPAHALKGRLGNLEGIRSDVFGWLEGFGAYLNNLYAVGKFFDHQTGENLKARVEMTLARFRSFYAETTYNVSDGDNFLKNGFFQQALEFWTPCDLNGNPVSVNQAVEAIGVGGSPLLINGMAIGASRQSLAEIKEIDGIQVLYLRNMGVAQSFSDIKRNGWHEEFDPDDELGMQTVLVADQLYMGVRIMPITSGRLSVRFRQSGGATSGWERDIDASLDWRLCQASDSVADPWEFPGNGKLVISYSGECYIRFVALQTDPVVNSKVEFSTLIEQNSRRITLEASRQEDNLATAVAQINIEFDNVKTTVTDNKDAADSAFANIISDLDDEVSARQSLEDTYKATWVYQNDHLLSLMAAEFDSNGKILGYADLKVQVENISTTVTDNKSAADKAFDNIISNLDDEVAARLGLADDLDDEITARLGLADDLDDEIAARQSLEETYKATWVYQNDHLLSLMAAEFDSNGKILGYADLKVQVENISTTVTDNKSAADKAFKNITDNLIPGLEDDIDTVNTKAKNAATAASNAATAAANAQSTANSASSTANSAATWINQNKNTLSAVAGHFDSNGHLSELSGYVATSSFSGLFSQSFNNSGAITSSSISAYISSFVDANGVKQLISEATIKADKINFKTGNFKITNGSGQTTLSLDSAGNLTISGTINGGSVFRYGNGDGIRLTDAGIERWNASANAWVPLYAGRYVKFVNARTEYLKKDDDFVVSLPYNTTIYLPSGCSNGKIFTIKTLNHTVDIKASGSEQLYLTEPVTSKDLNGTDRAELVKYGNYWYWNYMEI